MENDVRNVTEASPVFNYYDDFNGKVLKRDKYLSINLILQNLELHFNCTTHRTYLKSTVKFSQLAVAIALYCQMNQLMIKEP